MIVLKLYMKCIWSVDGPLQSWNFFLWIRNPRWPPPHSSVFSVHVGP